jgi:uncharacterized RDD family membrane protein YckC
MIDTSPSTGVVTESQLAGRGARLVAVLLDAVIGGILAAILFGLGGAGAMAGAEDGAEPNFTILTIGGILFLVYVIWQLWMLATQGQTLGKKMMNLRIVKTDTGRNGGFVPNVLLRAIVGQGLLGAIPFYGLVDALFIFRDDRRCIHDMIAGTAVVKGGA